MPKRLTDSRFFFTINPNVVVSPGESRFQEVIDKLKSFVDEKFSEQNIHEYLVFSNGGSISDVKSVEFFKSLEYGEKNQHPHLHCFLIVKKWCNNIRLNFSSIRKELDSLFDHKVHFNNKMIRSASDRDKILNYMKKGAVKYSSFSQ